jgi:hypothetical protein
MTLGKDADSNNDYRRSVAATYFEHVERQIALAATKAQLLIASISILITTYVRIIVDLKFFPKVSNAAANGVLSEYCSWIFVLAGVLLLLGLIAALSATVPRITIGTTIDKLRDTMLASVKEGHDEKKSIKDLIHFYDHDANISLDEYVEAAKSQTPEELERNLHTQTWGKSVWLRRINLRVTFAACYTAVAISLSAIAVFTAARVLFIN